VDVKGEIGRREVPREGIGLAYKAGDHRAVNPQQLIVQRYIFDSLHTTVYGKQAEVK